MACAQATPPKKTVVKTCVLPQDQIGSLMGNWRTLPIPVAFAQNGNWAPEEVSAITAAADTWNNFYAQSLGFAAVLDYGGANVRSVASVDPGETNVCGQGIMQGNTFVGNVVIYKQSPWPNANHDAIAITSTCPVTIPGQSIPSRYMGMMEVNYQDFFVQGTKQPDLQSIFLHEFGHLLGLDHSCDLKGKPGMLVCSNPQLPDAYFNAVLYPVILFDQDGTGEQRRDLTDDDEGRANCLYENLAGSSSSSSGSH
jgi:hypothetical protein